MLQTAFFALLLLQNSRVGLQTTIRCFGCSIMQSNMNKRIGNYGVRCIAGTEPVFYVGRVYEITLR
jgi:hypothetical protein